jgi:predicted hotdog family 3-hydroxylacyl-ACP dehydratase
MPQLTKKELSAFLPHTGAMRLIDRVETWDNTTIRCCTRSHHDPANPLRRDARLEAVTGLEYAAQVMGVHVGLLNRDRPVDGVIGYVGGLREVVFSVDQLDECPAELTIDATRLFEDSQSFMYQFAISSGGRHVMTGRASIFLKRAQS